MTSSNRASIAVVVLVVVLGAWVLLRTNTSEAGRDCRAMYHSARTAADTARIDTTFVPSSKSVSDPRSCGFMRSSARWQ